MVHWGARSSVLAVVMALLIIPVLMTVSSSGPSRVANSPSLDSGTYMEWSYFERSLDGDSWREGLQTASVSTGTWNSEDVYVVSGTLLGEYEQPDGSGDESGNWQGYYRQSDLALMYYERNLHITIDGMTVSADNSSFTDYEIPYLRWVKFPLKSTTPPTSWTDGELGEVNDWTVYSDGSEISSGNSPASYNYTRRCSDEISVQVRAGTYDTYVVKEYKEVPFEGTRISNTTTYYSDDLGWWVKQHTYAPYEMENVLIRSMEMISVSDNGPPVASAIPIIEMNEDDTYSDLDPNLYFTDPDGDDLDFAALDTGDLNVEISGDEVHITPPQDRFGTFNFNLTATDDRHSPVSSMVTVNVAPVDDPPVLSSGEVDPVQGNSETIFTFTVQVKDVEGDQPASVKVVIDGTPYTMTKGVGDIIAGIEYEWSGTLEAGDHSFHFEAGQTRSPVSGVIDGPDVLSPEEPQFLDPDLDVESGGTDTLCTYSITWIDEQNRDVDVYVVIDGTDTSEMYTEDTDAATGLDLSISEFLKEGEHYYHFEAHIGETIYRYPRNGELQGPEIYDPHIILSGYWPRNPDEDDDVTFYVIFQYGHGVFPQEQILIIDDEEYALDEEDGYPIDGLNLTYTIKLPKGSHQYGFRIEVDGLTISPATRTINIASASETDDDDTGGVEVDTDNEGKPAAFVVVILIIILVVVGIVAFLIVKGVKPPGKLVEDDFEEDGSSEGHVDRIRGL